MRPKVLARRGIVSGAILITGCVLLTSCSSGSISASASGGYRSLPGKGPAAPLAGSATDGHGGAQAAGQAAALAPAGQSIIYTASLTIRSGNVTAAAQRAIGIARAAGGYVSAEQQASSGSDGSAPTVSLTLKIPVPSYQDALGQLSSPALGKRLSAEQQATDVTEQVADVTSLVTSQQDAIAALQGLLKKAGSVSGLLEVQQQISSDESSLNSLEAQQRALDHQTSYATVTMTLLSPHAAVHKKAAAHRGFLPGLSGGWRALRHATSWALTAFGAALPFLVIVALLAGAGYAGRRRFSRKGAKPTAAA